MQYASFVILHDVKRIGKHTNNYWIFDGMSVTVKMLNKGVE